MPTSPPSESSVAAEQSSAFDLPDRLAAKRSVHLIGDDERHLARVAVELDRTVVDLRARLAEERRRPAGGGQRALDRDQEVHRLTARLRGLDRFGVDACLGRMVTEDGHPIYVGRVGLTDPAGERLLVDWRSPAAEPFFAATGAEPLGLRSRRRYRWARGRIRDYWDEVFDPEAPASGVAPDDQSAFIASLAASRSPRMRDVLGTLQADQDAIIRADSRGVRIVDGGPGTGKTVVALHRAAYLLYSDPRLSRGHGGVLVVGPSPAYLDYVGDVLPSLGEEGVQLCTIRDLVPERLVATSEPDERVAELKASSVLLGAIDRAVRGYEVPPGAGMIVETDWVDVELASDDWAAAFAAAPVGADHNTARDEVWAALLDIATARAAEDDDDEPRAADDEDPAPRPASPTRRALAQSPELRAAFAHAWPLLDPAGVVADLLAVPAHLAACAPTLSPQDVQLLRREDPRAWTVEDLPLLDAARHRIGDPDASRRRREREAAAALERERRQRVIDDLIEADTHGEGVMAMLRHPDLQRGLLDEAPAADADSLTGPFAHIVVDEAQELTDAEWAMLLRRVPSRSLTIVGDRAQSRRPFPESWAERLARVGLDRADLATLSVNYRTPEEVMAVAEPVIRAALPDANVPTSIRSSGVPVREGRLSELDGVLANWLGDHAEGTACVISREPVEVRASAGDRVRLLTPETAKGLEFDLVVIVEPERIGSGPAGPVDLYVAMTRATERLVLLHT